MPTQSSGWAIVSEVARLDGIGQTSEGGEQLRWVLAAERGVEPPAIVHGVDQVEFVQRCGSLLVAADVRRVDHDAELQVVAFGAHGLEREPVGEQLMVGDGDGRVGVCQAGAWCPAAWPR